MDSLNAKQPLAGLRPADLFRPLAGSPGSVWLDSSLTRSGWGRCSFLAEDPVKELKLPGDRDTFFAELNRIARDPRLTAIGFIGYEATLPFVGVESSQKPSPVPAAHFFVYDQVLRFDRTTETYNDLELAAKLSERAGKSTKVVTPSLSKQPVVKPVLTRTEYLRAIDKIKWHIHEGDIYQANFTCRFDVNSREKPFGVYQRLRNLNPCPYGAFLNFGDYQVLSSSPERMFLLDGDRITSTPIKGTIERGCNATEEKENLQRLLASDKDRAELLMIVDLVRNDLGKIAQTGSVTVDTLFRADIYSSLIHLVADISARLKSRTSFSDVLRALLPGGSITGAPKKRAVEIIDTLERSPRSVYTGCIGYLGGGRADFNIAIRTIVHREGTYHLHAGGGIVADSTPEQEYDEMKLKALNLFRAMGAKI